MHMAMTAKRRNKLRKLAEEIPVPEIYGDAEGRHAARRLGLDLRPDPRCGENARASRRKNRRASICATFIRCRTGSKKSSPNFKRIVVVEMNDQGIYGFGQLATILRARYCEPKIESVTKTDGLTFRVKEILEDVFKGKTYRAKHSARRRASAAFQHRAART